MINERLKQLKILSTKINERHGSSTIGVGASMKPMLIPRLRTGSLQFDFALGGGIPIGRATMFQGEKSSGKTSSMYRIMGMAQNLCANCFRVVNDLEVAEVKDPETGEVAFEGKGTCDCFKANLWEPKQFQKEADKDFKDRKKALEENSFEEFRVALIDAEGAYEPDWAHRLGMDNRRLLYVCPDTAEEAIDIYGSVIRTGSVDLIGLDSIAALTPSVEVEESVESWQQGLAARLVNKWVRLVNAGINAVYKEHHRLVTQMWINQVRQAIGKMYGDSTVLPCGKGQGFATSVEVKMWASEWEREAFLNEMNKEHHMERGVKVRMNFKVVKNKTSPSQTSGSYIMEVAGPDRGKVDEFNFVHDLAEKYGIIEKLSASKWKFGDSEFKRHGDLCDALREPSVFDSMKEVLLEKMIAEIGG